MESLKKEDAHVKVTQVGRRATEIFVWMESIEEETRRGYGPMASELSGHLVEKLGILADEVSLLTDVMTDMLDRLDYLEHQLRVD